MSIKTGLLAITVAGLAIGLMAATTTPWNWGTSQDDASDPDFAQSKAICRKLGAPVIPAADRPGAAEAAALKGCDSEALYYGEGMAPDYVKARQCAIIEDEKASDDEGFFGGKTILMQIYANGLGVRRNIALATALACEVEGAPAESDGRVLHLQTLAAKPDHFDVCDDITSGYADGFCTDRASTLAGFARDQKIEAVAKRFPPASAPLYTAMKTAFDAFTKAHAEGEVDLSGSSRAAFEIEAGDAENDQFLKDLTRLAEGSWPAASQADAVADAGLNQRYRKSLDQCTERADNFSTVRADDVRAAQRAWLDYRDAYLKFAAVAAPVVSQDAVAARLTKLRMAELDALPCS